MGLHSTTAAFCTSRPKASHKRVRSATPESIIGNQTRLLCTPAQHDPPGHRTPCMPPCCTPRACLGVYVLLLQLHRYATVLPPPPTSFTAVPGARGSKRAHLALVARPHPHQPRPVPQIPRPPVHLAYHFARFLFSSHAATYLESARLASRVRHLKRRPPNRRRQPLCPALPQPRTPPYADLLQVRQVLYNGGYGCFPYLGALVHQPEPEVG